MTESTGTNTTPTNDGESATTAAAQTNAGSPQTNAGSAAERTAEDATRPGVPVWRVGKPDAFLAADVATARQAILSIATESDIGKHLGARSEGVRCVTHLFESNKPGYGGWVWFASLARVSRGKASTVNEVGMLPTNDSVLAPAWVPWAERVRPEDQEEAAQEPHGAEPHDADSHDTAGDEAEVDDAAADTTGEHDATDGSYTTDESDVEHSEES